MDTPKVELDKATGEVGSVSAGTATSPHVRSTLDEYAIWQRVIDASGKLRVVQA